MRMEKCDVCSKEHSRDSMFAGFSTTSRGEPAIVLVVCRGCNGSIRLRTTVPQVESYIDRFWEPATTPADVVE